MYFQGDIPASYVSLPEGIINIISPLRSYINRVITPMKPVYKAIYGGYFTQFIPGDGAHLVPKMMPCLKPKPKIHKKKTSCWPCWVSLLIFSWVYIGRYLHSFKTIIPHSWLSLGEIFRKHPIVALVKRFATITDCEMLSLGRFHTKKLPIWWVNIRMDQSQLSSVFFCLIYT